MKYNREIFQAEVLDNVDIKVGGCQGSLETGSKCMEKAGIRLRDNGVAPISRTRSFHGGTGKENEKSSKY